MYVPHTAPLSAPQTALPYAPPSSNHPAPLFTPQSAPIASLMSALPPASATSILRKPLSSGALKQKDLIKSLPKTLTFDGRSKWEAFRLKFMRFGKAADWTEEDFWGDLCWCLTGKAAEYHALICERDEALNFTSVFASMEARFGEQELPEAAQIRFQQAVQSVGESLEEWADRVLTLGNRAFKTLPESVVY